MWLNRRNIETTHASQKLDLRRFGPFEIMNVVDESKTAFELKLPPQWRIPSRLSRIVIGLILSEQDQRKEATGPAATRTC